MVCPYYCFSVDWGSFGLESKYAKDLGVYIFYDEKKDIFLNKDGEEIDIQGIEMLPRTGVLEAHRLADAIDKHGGISVVNNDDYETTLNWPNYIRTKRQCVIMSGQEIIDSPEKIIELFGTEKVFFKTKDKNYSQVIDIEQLLNKQGNFYKALNNHANDDFIISDVVKIVEDEFGPLEYRGFVVDGRLLNVSRIHDFLMGSVPSFVLDKMEVTINSLKDSSFPNSYVVDLFVFEDGDKADVDVLECNPIISSGTYLYNSVFEQTADLEHKCPSKSIPIEKIKYGPASRYSFNVSDRPVPSICYEYPGGFAADLVSFAVLGRASAGMWLHIDTMDDIDSDNIGDLGFNDDFSCSNLDDEEEFKQLKKRFLEENNE